MSPDHECLRQFTKSSRTGSDEESLRAALFVISNVFDIIIHSLALKLQHPLY